jgi:dCMP deaminase
MSRPDWDEYFMRLALLASTRATCNRLHCGAIIVDPYNRVVATGYNGSPSGQDDCDTAGHEMVENSCVRTLHAESNAIDYAGRFALGCDLYCTASPCYDCAKRIINAGIVRVVFNKFYASRYGKSTKVPDFLKGAGIHVESFDSTSLEVFRSCLAELDNWPEARLAVGDTRP